MGIRLNVLVEGDTEEAFVNRVLAPHLWQHGVWSVARLVYTSRSRGRWYRGGLTTFRRARRDLLSWMKEDANADARFTTLFDLYRLPTDFPGMGVGRDPDPYRAVGRLETELWEDISRDLDARRFVPHLQLHEFEALVLSDPSALLAMYPGRKREVVELHQLVSAFKSPEEINLDDPPSKRIKTRIPEYEKVSAAVTVTGRIGLSRIRDRCPHFHRWVSTLEGLAT